MCTIVERIGVDGKFDWVCTRGNVGDHDTIDEDF